MNLKIITEDPLNILSSTKAVLEDADFVFINESKIDRLARRVDVKIKQGVENPEDHFGRTENLKNNVQLVFIEDVVNFCFWAEKGKEKWKVKLGDKIIDGGWYGLKACFERAIKENVPILDSKYIANISKKDAQSFFRGASNIEIPLLDERINNLREAGKILIEKYDGHFINVLEESGYDAVKLVQIIVNNFPSFRDITASSGDKVFFLKRAQICAHDLSCVVKEYGKEQIRNLDKLSACADYKIPQILRMFGVIEYKKELAEKIDNYILIPVGGREEIEIRSATIWGVELIRQKIKNHSAIAIDFALWLMSQDTMERSKPYHRTYSIFY